MSERVFLQFVSLMMSWPVSCKPSTLKLVVDGLLGVAWQSSWTGGMGAGQVWLAMNL